MGAVLGALAGGRSSVTARFRDSPDDFVVEEELGWEPDGAGEHLFLLIRKRGLSTGEAERLIADCAGVSIRQVSHAGLKDRNAVCTQWLSIHLPGREDPDFSPIPEDRLAILRQERNSRRLRIGTHAGNRFTITLRDIRDPEDRWESRLEQLRQDGVPNYFGEQRFGRDNINQVLAWFKGGSRPRGHQHRSLLLSTARALLFNRLLSWRVEDGSWNQYMSGDVMMLAGSNSHFESEEEQADELQSRVDTGDIHPAGPLWGRGGRQVRDAAQVLEQRLPSVFPVLCSGLERRGLTMQRRSLRLPVRALTCRTSEHDRHSAVVAFSLPIGAYATSVLRELCHYSDDGPLVDIPETVAVRRGQDRG